MDIAAIGRQFGLSPEQTQAAFEALAPVVAAGMQRNAGAGGGGLGDLLGALGGSGFTRYADDEQAYGQPQSIDDGNAILARAFGSKDVSRGVAQQLSATTGISDSILKKLLPLVAAFVMAQIAKKALGSTTAGGGSNGGGLGDILGQVLGGGQPAPRQQAPQGGGLGDILGDLLGGGQQMPRQQAPQAPQGGGLGDILGDLLGGGQQAPAQRQSPGGGLDDILGDILGGGARGGGSGSAGGSPVDAADELLRSVERALRNR